MKREVKNLLNYYKLGDTICEVRYGRNATVIKLSKLSITFKLEFSTKKVTLHSLEFVDEFYKSHPVL